MAASIKYIEYYIDLYKHYAIDFIVISAGTSV